MLNIICFIWELPQSILALLILLFYCRKYLYKRTYKKATIYIIDSSRFTGVSLGRFIILSRKYYLLKNCVLHEYGHSIQSLIFGPLYLIVIGIPSFIRAVIFKCKTTMEYYNLPWEKWADKLGKVERTENG